jgi:intracellular multiplication protein IcmE
MNNDDIDNDLDVEDFDDAGGFDDFNKKGTLGDVWRNNPMVKIGVILAGFAIVLGAIILFGGSKPPSATSVVSGGSTVSEAPGSSEVSKTMQDAMEERNVQLAEEALRTSGSAVPMPIDPAKNPVAYPTEQPSAEDPLERWRRMQEERIRQQEVIQQATPAEQMAPPVDTKTPAVNAMAQAMSTQMGAVLQNQPIPSPNYKRITSVNYLEDMERKKLDKYMQQQQMAMQNQQLMGGLAGQQYEDILLPAGTIEYGQLLIEANTDAPGPIIAQIVSGPLRGSRVIGSFTSTYDYITLNFNQVVIDGVNYAAEAVAIDPATTLPGMVTEIDRKYFTRIILPMAAQFVTGLADAVSESGTTTIFIEGGNVGQSTNDRDSRQEVASGIGEAGQALSDIIQEEANQTRPMLRIAAGTPIGILFVSPVSDIARGP